MTKLKRSNIVLLVIILLLVIPQTRKPIQVLLHKGVALINPVTSISESERLQIKNYNWKLLKENNTPFNFNKTKGKVVLINFWATWCPPCIAEMSSLQKLYSKYGERVKFLFITSDSKTKTEAFKTDKDYSFPVFNMLSQPPKVLMTTSIPRTVLIDKNGKIVIDKSGATDWFDSEIQTQIEALLE